MTNLVAVLLLSFALSSSNPLYPAGSKAVIIRIDDIQDFGPGSPLLQAEKTILQFHIEARIPSLLAVVASSFGKEPQLIDQIRVGLDQRIFTIGVHGWTHVPFAGMPLSNQVANMRYAKDRLETIFGVQVLTFIPPYYNFDDTTIQAMKSNRLTAISSASFLGDIPREDNGITYVPETVTFAEVNLTTNSWQAASFVSITQQIQDSWDNYGVAVVTIHPQQFAGEHYGLWNSYMQMLEWMQANDGTIIRLRPPSPRTEYSVDPLQLSIGIVVGVISATLVNAAFAKRSNAKPKQKTERTSSHVDKPLSNP